MFKEEDIRKRALFDEYLKLVQQDIKNSFTDKSSFLTVNCPACNGEKYKAEIDKWGFTYTLCEDCGTLFVNPRPSLKLLNEFYEDSVSTEFWVNNFFKPVAEIRRQQIFRPRAEFIAGRFEDLCDGIIGDIGAGYGLFLEELQKLWSLCKMIAIEPSRDMSKICSQKGLSVINDSFESIDSCDYKFDLLVSFELFEHVYNPNEFLTKALSMLKPGGYLVITTLNGQGFDIQLLWEKSKSVAPPHHLNFFNPDSIRILLEGIGFEVEEINTPGNLDWDIVEGMMKNEKINVGRFWDLLSKKSESVKLNTQEWIKRSGLSSHMRIIAKKPLLY